MSDDLVRLVDDLFKASDEAAVAARAVTQRSARKIRDDARRLAPRTRLPHYAKSITYETTYALGGVVAEIGPEKGGQGSLGHILERGTVRTPPHAHLGPAFDMEEGNYLSALSKVLDPFRKAGPL
jgi:HK97 gp10 family phage protein